MSQGTIRRKDQLSKAIMMQMEHQIKPRWYALADTGTMVCCLMNFTNNTQVAEGRGRDHEEAFDAAFDDWNAVQDEAKKVAVENESLRERLRDLEQQVEKSKTAVDSETSSEDPAPAKASRPKQRRPRVTKSTPPTDF